MRYDPIVDAHGRMRRDWEGFFNDISFLSSILLWAFAFLLLVIWTMTC